MAKRFVALWFRHLKTDRLTRRQPALQGTSFVLAAPERGRLTITAASPAAEAEGIRRGTGVADARALLPGLQVLDDEPAEAERLLHELAVWCIRYTPLAAVDAPDGVLLDASGCAHLWGGEEPYLADLTGRLRAAGYGVRAALADTVGAAWAVSRYGRATSVVPAGAHADALRPLPPAALRLAPETVARLERLGLRTIGRFMDLPRAALRRRFGTGLLQQLDYALGAATEPLRPVVPGVVLSERLPSADAIATRAGIETALRRLLAAVCARLAATEEGLRSARFTAHGADGSVQCLTIGTVTPSRNAEHLFRLFDLKLETLEPGPGFELFLLEVPVVEPLSPLQEMLWHTEGTGDETAVAELLNRMAGKLGIDAVHRYLPDAHYWPERSYRLAPSLTATGPASWYTDRPRPVHLLPRPEPIQVMVRLPDYPPLHFIYRGKVCRVARADGPERIEPEWWLEPGQHRDYYCVEDGDGARYWIFRSGHYADSDPEWFLHGFFA